MFKFKIPSGSVNYGILEFAIGVLNTSPSYELRSKQRLGYKAIDAIDQAIKEKSEYIYMQDDVAILFKEAVENTPIPNDLYIFVDGEQRDKIPRTFFARFYEAVENGVEEGQSQ